VGPRAGLDILERKQSLDSTGIRPPDRPARSIVAIPTELTQLTLVVCIVGNPCVKHSAGTVCMCDIA
jgi:hypothetical protein